MDFFEGFFLFLEVKIFSTLQLGLSKWMTKLYKIQQETQVLIIIITIIITTIIILFFSFSY